MKYSAFALMEMLISVFLSHVMMNIFQNLISSGGIHGKKKKKKIDD